MSKIYVVSFRCYYGEGQKYTQHTQELPLEDIGRWLEAYRFTHPAVYAISVKVWMNSLKKGEKNETDE